MDDPTAGPAAGPAAGLGIGQAQQSSGQSPGGPSLVDSMTQQHLQTRSMFDKLSKGQALISKVRKSMDTLLHMGDSITQEDIIKAAGGWVSAGLTPKAVAVLLAQMPQDGAPLAAWVTTHDDELTQREAQMSQAHEMMRHELGVNAVRELAARHAQPDSPPQGADPGTASGPDSLPPGQGNSPGGGLALTPTQGNA